ncbi:glycosyltransferase [archaeon]|jgi:hypothetical protein|nr:glycosyltransferase [archaeon]
MTKILLVCIARHLGDVAPQLFGALRRMVEYTLQTPGYKQDTIDFIVLTEQPRDKEGKRLAGNQAIRWNMKKVRPHALKHYHYILRMDSDMIPPPHALVTLIKTSVKHNAPIVTSLTPERPAKCGTDQFSQLMNWNENEPKEKIISSIKQLKPFVCTGNAGVGFMLMTSAALKKIKWARLKDDFGFWNEVHKLDIKVVCTPRVVCAHKEHRPAIVRGEKWIVEHWRKVILRNLAAHRNWYHGFPYKWWHGHSVETFLVMLPLHLNQVKEPKWFTYQGNKNESLKML